MRFILIDKIVSLEEGRRLTAVKSVSLAEEYLGDHFPTFPVLPGVLLLEGLVESAGWLVRKTENFAHSMILLAEARNVKYRSFLPPGSQIQYTVEAKAIEESISSALFDVFYEKKPLTTEAIVTSLHSSVPLSKTMSEDMATLRSWSEGRARQATSPEKSAEVVEGKRRLEL